MEELIATARTDAKANVLRICKIRLWEGCRCNQKIDYT